MHMFHSFGSARIPSEKSSFRWQCSHSCAAVFTLSLLPKCLPPIASLSHHGHIVCWTNTDIQNSGYFFCIDMSVFLHKRFRCGNVFVRHYAVCPAQLRGVLHRSFAAFKLSGPLVHLLQRRTRIAVLHFHPATNFGWFNTFATQKTHYRLLL